MLFQLLVNLVYPISFKTYRLCSKEYTYTLEEDEKDSNCCGLITWTIMCDTIFLETKITTNHLEEQLKETTPEQHGNDLVNLFTDMEDLHLKIEAEKGHAYDSDRYMTLIFSKLEN